MNSNNQRTPTLDMPDSFFAGREQAGPLTPLEACYRAIGTLGFAGLIRCDAVMGMAELTPAGERWLEPVVRHVLHLDGPLPLSALDWIRLYHQARDTALRHFSAWNTQANHYAPVSRSLPGSRPLPTRSNQSGLCRLTHTAPFPTHKEGDLQ